MSDPIQIAPGVTVHTHACGEDGIFVNAFLVETERGVVGVDATLTVSTARALRARLHALGKPLLAVLVTHPHPDHVAGLAELVTSDDVPILATKPVLDLMRTLEEPKRAQWGPVYKEEWVQRWRYPNRVVADGEVVELDGVAFRVHDIGLGGDSGANSVWTIDAPARAAFLSDLVFHGVHSYLADGGVLAWLANLERADRICAGMATVFPGHGAAGSPDELIARQRAYLLAYVGHTKELAHGLPTLSADAKRELTRRMAEHLPHGGLEFLVGMSADAVAKEMAGAW